MDKVKSRKRRAAKTRAKIKGLKKVRLSVHRTPCHIYAQIIAIDGKVLVAASTLEKEVKQKLTGYTGNIAAAEVVGKIIAERAQKEKITKVAFDRSGFQYHGRVKALAEAAREGGLEF